MSFAWFQAGAEWQSLVVNPTAPDWKPVVMEAYKLLWVTYSGTPEPYDARSVRDKARAALSVLLTPEERRDAVLGPRTGQ